MKRVRLSDTIYRVTQSTGAVTLDDGSAVDSETVQRVLAAVKVQSARRAKANRQARHEALTSLGLVRCRINGRTFYE